MFALLQPRESRLPARLLANAYFSNDLAVAITVCFLQVVQKTATLRHEHKETAARAMVFLVGLEVFRQLANALAEDRNLHLGATGIRVVRAKF